MQYKMIAAILIAGFSASAMADIGVGIEAGTTGYGADLAYKLSDSVGARIGYTGLNYSRSMSDTDIKYDAKLKLSNLKAVADWNLIGGFRLTGGLYVHDNKVDLNGEPNGSTYTINGDTYQASQIGSVKGRVKFGSSVSPYLGIGYGMIADKGFGFFADVGAIYLGKAKVSVDASCGSAMPASTCAQLQSDVEHERQKVYDKLNGYRFWPVVSVGVSYAF
jgi:hypothetical protein